LTTKGYASEEEVDNARRGTIYWPAKLFAGWCRMYVFMSCKDGRKPSHRYDFVNYSLEESSREAAFSLSTPCAGAILPMLKRDSLPCT